MLNPWIVVVCTVAVLVAMSVIANLVLADRPRLVMHWGLDGRPTWSAPRRLALSFMPVLALGVLSAEALGGPRVAVLLPWIGGVFVAVHALHLWLARR